MVVIDLQQLQLHGLQKQTDVALNSGVKFKVCKWPDLDVSQWPPDEQFHHRIQIDG